MLLHSVDVKAQVIVEIDPIVPVRIGWEYTLPDTNVDGFRIYRKDFVNNVAVWNLIGTVATPILEFDLPMPSMGTYILRAFNSEFESENSEELTLVYTEPPLTQPLAPTNLRVIQIR